MSVLSNWYSSALVHAADRRYLLRCCFAAVCVALLALYASSAAYAVEGDESDAGPLKANEAATLIWYFENDLFGGTDQFYTNAVQMTLISPDLVRWADDKRLPDALDTLVEMLPFAGQDGVLYNVGLSLGQHIYTPSDIQATALLDDDRPYAGFLYGAAGFHAKRQNTLDSIIVTLGLVGPAALGEEAQNGVHSVRNIPTAKGWDNQLNTEPALMITWERAIRWNSDGPHAGWDWDVISHTGLTAGNVMTFANIGGEVRLGWNLPSDFGTSLIRPGGGVGGPTSDDDPRLNGGFGVYVFAGVDGRAVARNIFLDGNTFEQSHSVTKKTLVADINGGIACVIGNWRLSYTHVYRTEEFTQQKRGQNFGSVQVALTF